MKTIWNTSDLKRIIWILFIGFLVLIMSACDQGQKPTTDSVQAVKIATKPNSLEIGKSVSLNATVEGENVSQEVMWSSSDLTVATIDAGNLIALKAGSTTITAKSKINPAKSDSFTLLVVLLTNPPTPLVINSVELVHTGTFSEYQGLQIRQDYGGIVLVARGTGLEKGANPRLIGPDGRSIPGVILQDLSNNTSVFALLNISKGVSIGQQTLRFDVNNFGPVEKTSAVEITPIVFSPTGNDTSGAGTFENPFKTFEGATYTVAEGDTMYLSNGTHKRNLLFTVPEGVTIEGESQAGAIVAAEFPMAPSDGFNFTGNATMKTLTLNGFFTSLFHNQDSKVLTLDSVIVQNSVNRSLQIQGKAKVIANNSIFRTSDQSSIRLQGESELVMNGGQSIDNGNAGVLIDGIKPKATLISVTISGNGKNGAGFDDGIMIQTNANLKVRNSTITGNGRHGVLISGAADVVDFGTEADLGNNDIKNNRTSVAYLAANKWEVSDERPARVAADGSIATFVGSRIQDRGDLTGTVTGVDNFSSGGINYWRIMFANNRIQLPTP